MSLDLLGKAYEPHNVEKRWYEYWEKEGLFAANETSDKKGFSIVIPPPNVTGVLHMGHALNVTMQDILCRYRRIRGDNVLWMPGTDHAGIATQNVVEKKLRSKGIVRSQLGREKFIEAVWDWRTESGGAIINQLKRLGASCDWERERFTMDQGLSRAVRVVFVRLYNEGLIYRGNYIINWCPRCGTALSDLEVEHSELDGYLYHIRYPFEDGSSSIVVATTRPETMFGDTAVAVNPDDERFSGLELQVVIPLTKRSIPVIKDSYVDVSFGTGALKVTPAHDPNDFEIGKRHNLQRIKVINDDGIMMSEAGEFEGLDRFECRKSVVKSLEKKGLLEKVEPYRHSVGHCYRCATVIEPNLSKQWFIRTAPLAAEAIKAVKNGDTRIIPAMWENTYFDWMNNIKDWCISRQIWWGHQIPVWTCSECGKIVVEANDPSACPDCGKSCLVQEPDVLDTWFSSALWPFSTMGWPDQMDLLDKFYPTSVLVTGFDILFFWVARMMMMGIHFIKDVPFKDVYVHALVCDEDGKKMSKSKGNVIDPLTVIENYGTDAFRYTLASLAAQGRDIKMSEKRVEGYRHFINKLWNASRFALSHMNNENIRFKLNGPSPVGLFLPDKWIFSRLSKVAHTAEKALENYRFNDAAGALYQFVWHEFCDWYIEAIKPSLYAKDNVGDTHASVYVLWRTLCEILVLLHPFIPFVTEEIWQKLPGTDGSIMKASFSLENLEAKGIVSDPEAELHMDLVTGIITGIRNIRGEMNISPSSLLSAVVQLKDESDLEVVNRCEGIIVNLARLGSFSARNQVERPKSSATAVVGGATIFVLLEGIIDFEKEVIRLEKEMSKISKELNVILKKLNNQDFLSKAPEDVVDKVREKQHVLYERQQKIQANLEKIKALTSES